MTIKSFSYTMKQWHYLKGYLSEIYVMIFLTLKGYKILKHRYKTIYGEIDIVACKDNDLIAIEVKYRKKIDDALFSLSQTQIKRIQKALINISHHYKNHGLRCDMCGVNASGYIRHLKNISL